MKYSIGFRNSILKKVLPPENRKVSEVAKEVGITAQTISSWMEKAKSGTLPQREDESTPASRSMSEKLRTIIESKSVPTKQKGAWLRERGLHAEHLPLFEQEVTDIVKEKSEKEKKEIRDLKKKNKQLERELARKDKALAEMAAIITLKKKAEALWGDGEDDSSG